MSPPPQVLRLQMALDQVERGLGELRGEAPRGCSRVPHLWVSTQALEGAGNPRSQVSPALPCRLLVSLSVCPSSMYLCSFQALPQSQAPRSISPGFGTGDGTQPGEAQSSRAAGLTQGVVDEGEGVDSGSHGRRDPGGLAGPSPHPQALEQEG